MKLDYGTGGHKGLSYSRLGTLGNCPRKFQIENSFGLKDRQDSVTFSFGHAVAAGIQSYFEHQSLDLAIMECAKFYTMPWFEVGTAGEVRGKKNVWYAVYAVQCFVKQIESAITGDLAVLQGWEIAHLTTDTPDELKPAVEIQFRILLEDDFVYEGHIDLVIRNKITGQYAILELKTTTFSSPNEATYGKSSQALSYSVVLDAAVGASNTAYKVFYLVWSSSAQRFFIFEFTKQAKHRLDWLNNIIRDCERISYYQAAADEGIPYPNNQGANCYAFFRQCEYYTTCDMEDSTLKMALGSGSEADTESFDYTDRTDFVFTLEQIVNTQIEKIEHHTGHALDTGDDNATIIEL